MKNYTEKASKGIFIIGVGTLVGYILAYLFRLVLTKNLTVADYGLFYSCLSFILFFTILKDLGVGAAFVNKLPLFSKSRYRIKSLFLQSVYVRLAATTAVSIILFLISGFLAKNYFHSEKSLVLFRVIIIYFFLSSLDDAFSYFFQAFQKFRILAIQNISKMIVLFLSGFFLFYFTDSYLVPVYAYIISIIITILIIFKPFKSIISNIKTKIIINKKDIKTLLVYGFPLILGITSSSILGYADTLILTYFRSLSEVGVYNVVLPTSLIILFITAPISTVIFPITSELWAKKKLISLRNGIRRLEKYILLVSLPVGIIFIGFSTVILRIIFGEAYVSGSLAFKILAFGVMFYTLASVLIHVINGAGNTKYTGKVIFFGALINIIGNFILIPSYGIIGAAIMTTVSYLFILTMLKIKVKEYLEIDVINRDIIFIIINSMILFLIIFLLGKIFVMSVFLETLIIIIISLILYTILSFLTKVITMQEIKSILSMIIKR